MFRSMTALLALTFLMAAAPVQRQPTPQAAPPNTMASDPAMSANQKSQAAQEESQKANAARDKEWDKKLKGTMGTICRGC